MNTLADVTCRARKLLPLKNVFRHQEASIVIACILRYEDIRPLRAPWWRGKEV